MDRWRLVFIVPSFLVILSGCEQNFGNTSQISVIGKTHSGEEKAFSFPEGIFHRVMTGTLERVHRSTLKSLDQSNEDPEFELSRVIVGLKLEAEVGIRNLMELGTEGAFELRYERLPMPESRLQGVDR